MNSPGQWNQRPSNPKPGGPYPGGQYSGGPGGQYPGGPGGQYGAPGQYPGGYAPGGQPGGQYPYAGPMYAPPTNSLAVPALICGIVAPLVGIILGHISLKQIRERGEAGHGMALAGTIIGYILMGLYIVASIVFLVAVSTVASGVAGSLAAVATTSSVPSYQTLSEIDTEIRAASYGDCFHRESSGGDLDVFASVSCDQYEANVEVSSVTTSTSNCGDSWVQTTTSGTKVVLCLSTH